MSAAPNFAGAVTPNISSKRILVGSSCASQRIRQWGSTNLVPSDPSQLSGRFLGSPIQNLHIPMNGCTSRKAMNPGLVILKDIGYGLEGSTWPSASIVTRGQSTNIPSAVQNAKNHPTSLLLTVLDSFWGCRGCFCFSRSLSFRDLDIHLSILQQPRRKCRC